MPDTYQYQQWPCATPRFGVRINAVAKPFQILALILVAGVLGDSQCLEICGIVNCHRPSSASTPVEADMPCHQAGSSSDSPASPGADRCFHQALAAEESSGGSWLDRSHLHQAAVAGLIAVFAPVAAEVPLNIGSYYLFEPRRAKAASILRI